MKLFTKYNRVNLFITIVIFLVSSIIFYFLFRLMLVREVDEDLQIEQREIQNYAAKNNRLPDVASVNDQRFVYTETTQPAEKTTFRTFIAYDSLEKENGNFREIIFGLDAGAKHYRVQVIKSMEATDDLLHSVLLIVIPAILLILVVSFLINRLVLKKLWRPFYDTLGKMKFFSVTQNEPLHFSPVQVEEFARLNATLETSTARAREDYVMLKEFTENASHEMQTPLAIIRSKLDMLIQDEDLSETQSVKVQAVYESIQKLNHLSQSLLLLARIENRQFDLAVQVNLQDKIREKSDDFHELWENKNIQSELLLDDAVVKMNDSLADILLNNLMSNATLHNMTGGKIKVQLDADHLIISNTSADQELQQKNLFSRFYRKGANSGQNGLGLSIIRKICEVSGFGCRYYYQDGLHIFNISLRAGLPQ